jgi:Spy/CpxP family protein refolding chaperone
MRLADNEMKRTRFFKLFMVLALCVAAAVGVSAQEGDIDDGPQDGDQPVAGRRQEPRFNLLRQLGLSREQIQRIRRMNQARKPLIESAQQRFREANRLLDAAIYADEVNEEDVRARLKEVQLAQAELIRIRSMDELAMRRLLTADQLLRFRELRARFDQDRPNFPARQPMQRPRAANGYTPTDVKTQTVPTDKKAKP